MWRNDEPHLFQIGEFRHVSCDDHVTTMDRVKRSEKKSDFHFLIVSALTLKKIVDEYLCFLECKFKIVVDNYLIETKSVC